MDVEVSKLVRAAPGVAAAIMFDPLRDPEWIGGARAVERLTADPHSIGARVKRTGGFLGKSFSWVTELVEFVPERLMRMRFVEGPMKGEVIYRIEPDDGDGARISVRNSGSSSFNMPGMAWMLKRSVGKDLGRLAALIEASRG